MSETLYSLAKTRSLFQLDFRPVFQPREPESHGETQRRETQQRPEEVGAKLPSLSLALSMFQLVEKRRPSAEGRTHIDMALFIHPVNKHSSDHVLVDLLSNKREKQAKQRLTECWQL